MHITNWKDKIFQLLENRISLDEAYSAFIFGLQKSGQLCFQQVADHAVESQFIQSHWGNVLVRILVFSLLLTNQYIESFTP